MLRSELEHVIRASGEIADDGEIIIIGSQAILGQFPDAPVRLLMSRMICSDDEGRPAGLCFISTPQVRMNKNTPLNQN